MEVPIFDLPKFKQQMLLIKKLLRDPQENFLEKTFCLKLGYLQENDGRVSYTSGLKRLKISLSFLCQFSTCNSMFLGGTGPEVWSTSKWQNDFHINKNEEVIFFFEARG